MYISRHSSSHILSIYHFIMYIIIPVMSLNEMYIIISLSNKTYLIVNFP